MDNLSPMLISFVLPLLIALLGAVPSAYLLIRGWKRNKRQDTIAEMTAAGEITDAAATLVGQLREECQDLRVRLSELEKDNRVFKATVEELTVQVIHQQGLIDKQEICLREQEQIIAKQNGRISDLEVENEKLRKRNMALMDKRTKK